MNKKILAMDVGGTHTRARIFESADDFRSIRTVVASSTASITDKPTFLQFTRQFILDAGATNQLDLAVLCFAGPVIGPTVSLINWTQPADLDLDELAGTGLHRDKIILLNDMEAAGYGLIAYQGDGRNDDRTTLYPGMRPGMPPHGNTVLLMPGTGIGLAGLIIPATGLDYAIPVTCEMQHTAIAPLDAEHGRICQLLAGRLGKPRVSWEDFISGRGLVDIHKCLHVLGDGSDAELTAAMIATRALQSSDPYCVDALNLFYRCAGALAQVVALTFQAYGGIYLAGTSTRTNLGFIQHSPFLAELHSNEVRGDLLKLFPVYLLSLDLNLEGACFAAGKYYKN